MFQKVGLISKTSLGFRRGSLIKFHPISLRIRMIRIKTLGPKRDRVEAHQMRSVNMFSVERVIMVNAWLERAIVLVVEIVYTRLGISLI